ncbi:MAG: tRNA preQ1(34) S-adenosylmethionine ribosyltransferase-isomerase QueA [Terracidiphilus sp.]|jgi:S-adenosylmethionine:tRNA ribosyltransferase-isomerase
MTSLSEEGEPGDGLRVSDFDFDLPAELIAQQPPAQRGQSRMLVMNRSAGAVRDSTFAEFPSLLNPGDLLVLNDTRVIPARLFAHRMKMPGAPGPDSRTWESTHPTDRIEVMLTEQVAFQTPGAPGPVSGTWERTRPGGTQTLGAPSIPLTGVPTDRSSSLGWCSAEWVGNHNSKSASRENLWRALVRPGRKVAIGEILVFPDPSGGIALEAEVIERGQFGERLLRFKPVDDFFAVLDRIGHIPLPPYIHRDDETADRERYQTVFSRERGSVAAPTAGLHFTPQILDALAVRGVEIARLTLHVSLGTFAPLRVERVDQVHLHRERYSLSAPAAGAINRAVSEGRRIVAVGTTVVRTLEHCALQTAGSPLEPHSGETEIFISPGFQFRLVSALLTNFHLPQSSLLMLVSAFAGREPVLAAYRHAVQQNYRFFSYGDCMFLG